MKIKKYILIMISLITLCITNTINAKTIFDCKLYEGQIYNASREPDFPLQEDKIIIKILGEPQAKQSYKLKKVKNKSYLKLKDLGT